MNRKTLSLRVLGFVFLGMVLLPGFLTEQSLKPLTAIADSKKVALRFAQLSDTHIMVNGVDRNQRMLKEGPELLSDALEKLNQIQELDFILFTGDFVNTPSAENFRLFFDLVRQKTRVPVYLVLGNHDVGVRPNQTKQWSIDVIKANLRYGFNERGKGYYAFSPHPKVLWLVLDGTTDERVTSNGFIPNEELHWVEAQLRENQRRKRPATVFVTLHFPPVEPIHSNSHQIVEPDVTNLLALLNADPFVSGVFTGHYHTARIMKHHDIYYFSSPALIEYPNAFRVFTVYHEGVIQAHWYETRLKDIQEMSRQRSQWAQTARGNPAFDHEVHDTLRYFPRAVPSMKVP